MNKQNASPPSACGESTSSGRKVLMISVFLCDPQPIVQEGLKTILDGQENFELIGTAGTLEEAFSEIGHNPPNLAIVDRSFGIHNLLDWITRLRQANPATQLVLWAATISDLECFRVLQAGARGILRKTASHDVLFHCLQTVARKELWTEDLFASPDSPLDRPRNRPRTPREQEVADLVSKGMKNREIGESLSIATGTVKIHLMHIFEKTGIRDRFELALHGLRLACERERTPSAVAEQQTAGPEKVPSLLPEKS